MRIDILVLMGFLVFYQDCNASEHPILNYIPRELKRLWDPEEVNDGEHPGVIERQRRDSEDLDYDNEGEITYTVYTRGSGAPCIFARTGCTFYIQYRTPRNGIRNKKVEMPIKPNITGSCSMEGDSSMITMLWSVFNFSLIFTKNAEGNSYYLNQAILKFTQLETIFPHADYNGIVILETKVGKNYYFTSLGKSYLCQRGVDQGPIKMYNTDDEVMGNMTLYNSKFQPFVKRAKGVWGESEECLPRAIQVLREDVVPYAVSMVYIFTAISLITGYGIFRYFRVKKQSFECYQENGDENVPVETIGEGHEMNIKGATRLVEEYVDPQMYRGGGTQQEVITTTSFQQRRESQPTDQNPFRKDKPATTNPFAQ